MPNTSKSLDRPYVYVSLNSVLYRLCVYCSLGLFSKYHETLSIPELSHRYLCGHVCGRKDTFSYGQGLLRDFAQQRASTNYRR
eukprot:s910_g19.t1